MNNLVLAELVPVAGWWTLLKVGNKLIRDAGPFPDEATTAIIAHEYGRKYAALFDVCGNVVGVN